MEPYDLYLTEQLLYQKHLAIIKNIFITTTLQTTFNLLRNKSNVLFKKYMPYTYKPRI